MWKRLRSKQIAGCKSGRVRLAKLAKRILARRGTHRLTNRRAPFPISSRPKFHSSDALQPDITVLIPAFRHEGFIEDALRSVLGQTYGGFQILVIDDASPDETAHRARLFRDPRITVKTNPSNKGLGNSILSAVEEIDTSFVALLNSDDVFHPERLERCRAVLLESTNAQLIATGISLVDSHGGRITLDNVSRNQDGQRVYEWVRWFHRVQSSQSEDASLFLRLLRNNFLVTSSNIVCRTSYLREHAEALKNLKYCLDWQLFLDAALDDGLMYLPEELVAYRLHSSNTVWFTPENRGSYFLEVNRVAAHALKSYLSSVARSRLGEAEVEKMVAAVVLHLDANSEVDGLALYLNEILPAVQLQSAGECSPTIRTLIQRLAEQARRKRAGCPTKPAGWGWSSAKNWMGFH